MRLVAADALAQQARHAHHERRRAVEPRARHGAAAAAKLGLALHPRRQRRRSPSGRRANALLDRLLGAEIRYVATREARASTMEAAAAAERAAGRGPTSSRSAPRRRSARRRSSTPLTELLEQIPPPDVIVHASSSGGTQAGLVAGCALAGVRTRVVGISADEPARRCRRRSGGILAGLARSDWPDRRATAFDDAPRSRSTIGSSATATACRRRNRREAIELLARTEALFLDPTYTAKAMAGLHRATCAAASSDASQTVLFWHTGGQVGYFRVNADDRRLTEADVPGRGADGDRLEAPARHRVGQGARRRRAVSGPEGTARAQLAADLPVKPAGHHAVVLTHAHLDHCGYLPRLVAAGLPRPHLLHARHPGSLPHRAARLGAHPGRGCGERQPPRVLEARAGAAALHRGRRVPRASRSSSRSATTGRCRSPTASRSTSSTPATCSAPRTRASASAARRSSSAAISAASTGPCCPIRRWSRRPTTCWSSRPTATACTRKTTTASGWRRRSRRRPSAAARSIIPAFAIGRVEELIYWIKRLEEEKRIPVLPVFVDSPMATEALAPLHRARARARRGPAAGSDRREGAARPAARGEPPERRRRRRGRNDRSRLLRPSASARSPRPGIEAADESKMPAIVISSSGMATGGRVLHHLKAALPDPRNTVLSRRLPGRRHPRPSARRTARRRSRSTARSSRCTRASRRSTRCRRTPTRRRSCAGCGGFKRPPAHDVPRPRRAAAMEALQATIKAELGWQTKMPQHEETVELA